MQSDISLKGAIKDAADEKKDPAGNEYRSLSLAQSKKLSVQFSVAMREVEMAALQAQIIPERYHRSHGTLGLEGQIQLLQSKVAVIGAGGLGGFVIELLARMGLGYLIVVDDDSFADSNLNRQLFSLNDNLGKPKVEEAARRVAQVNEAVEVKTFHCRAGLQNLPSMIKDCDLVIDCLDNLPSRFDLEKICSEMQITMIHGAIAGFLGQIAVVRPGRSMLTAIYGNISESSSDKGIETKLGNPAFTPAMLASWQAGEAVKLLAGLDGVLEENKLLIIDMLSGESYQVELGL